MFQKVHTVVSGPITKVKANKGERSHSALSYSRQRQRGEREPYRCANVFFQPINLSPATPQKNSAWIRGGL